MLISFASILLGYLREVAEVVLVGFVIAGAINAVVNKEAVVRYLGQNLIVSNLLGATIGVVTPLCCCSAIPTALTLYRAGSRRGPACAFLIATPWFNWYGITALVIFLGVRVSVVIAVSAVVIAFMTGVLIDLVIPAESYKSLIPLAIESAACSCGDTCCSPADTTQDPLFDFSAPGAKLREGLRFALDLLREVGPWIIIGVVLGAAVEALVPEHVFTQYLGGASLLGLLAAILVAGLFSADSLGTLPWVQSLLSKGLGPGSAMVLLVAGVGTNLSTLGPVARLMGRQTAVIYGTSVVVLAGVLGLGLNLAL
ncbi:MAG: permease [Chloroflexota bacterium]